MWTYNIAKEDISDECGHIILQKKIYQMNVDI